MLRLQWRGPQLALFWIKAWADITSGERKCTQQRNRQVVWAQIALVWKINMFFAKTAVLIWNPPYCNGDIVEKKIITISERQYGRQIIWFLVLACMVLVENKFEILFKCGLWTRLFFSIGQSFILVEHISTVVLDTKTLYYRKDVDKCPSTCEVIIGWHNKISIINSLSAEKI